MSRLIDLTAVIQEGMIQNAPFHPRAPVLWLNQNHNVTQWYQEHLWRDPNMPPLYDGLPPEAGQGGKGHGQQSEQIIIGSHMGTHIDAPLHFDPDDEHGDATGIPLEKCVGDAVLLDLRFACEGDGHVITPSELSEAEERSGTEVRDGDIVILNTGHAEKYAYGPLASRDKYAPTHPGLDYDCAPWFIDRRVHVVGVDTANLDRDHVLAVHVNFLLRRWIDKEPIYIIENLVNLERIEQARFQFIGLPLPLHRASGSPIRAVAVVDS